MVQLNSLTSCLSLAMFLYFCIGKSYANAEEQLSSSRGLATVWDVDYLISQTGSGPYDIEKFWVKVFINIYDDYRNVRVAAALSKEGLFLYPLFAQRLPKKHFLYLGGNYFEYEMDLATANKTSPCASSPPTALSLEGTEANSFSPHDIWIKKRGFCGATYNAPFPLCYPHFNSWEHFTCDTELVNLTTNTPIPIWKQDLCYHAPRCVTDNYLIKVLDAEAIQECYQGTYSAVKNCFTRAPTPAPTPSPTPAPTTSAPTRAPTTRAPTPVPTQAPTFPMGDCGLPKDAETLPDFMGTVNAIGYKVPLEPDMKNGVQLHLVPFDPSSCPVTSPINIFGSNIDMVRFPEGCEGYVYATAIQQLSCSFTAKYKFQYQTNGRFAIRVTDDARIYTP